VQPLLSPTCSQQRRRIRSDAGQDDFSCRTLVAATADIRPLKIENFNANHAWPLWTQQEAYSRYLLKETLGSSLLEKARITRGLQ
jgi:hypothetical protein